MKIVHGEGGTNGTISLERCQRYLVSDGKSIPSTCKFQSPLVTIASRPVHESNHATSEKGKGKRGNSSKLGVTDWLGLRGTQRNKGCRMELHQRDDVSGSGDRDLI